VTLVFGARERHHVVDALLRDLDAVDRSIDAEDEMLLYDLAMRDGDWDAGLASYFATGRALASAVGQVARWRGPADLRLLDFASGYGRVTRFLVREVPRARLCVSDVVRRAVEFQTATFGVRGLVSTTEPDAFACDERFELIFVTSLFTHLPARTFHGWLSRLVRLLAPRGVLAFSVHDASLLVAAREPSAEGIRFEARSESRSLDPRVYGSSWVSEAFVRGAIEACAPGASWMRVPRALCQVQDLYVVAPDGETDVATLGFDPGPIGVLDVCRVEGGVTLVLRGWAAQRVAAGRVAAVRVLVEGREVAECRRLADRPDVAGSVPEAALECGFEVRVPLPERSRHGVLSLLVEAETTTGVRGALFAGTLAQALRDAARTTLAYTEREASRRARRLAAEADALRARIAAMESSRFWKLRNH
jgi:SAM-dependent methyltransferase